jgi:hypothetical protein
MTAPDDRLPDAEIKAICDRPETLKEWTKKELAAEERPYERKMRFPMARALVRNDMDAFQRMAAEHPEEVQFAAQILKEFNHPRQAGRPKIEETYENMERTANLEAARWTMILIRLIWRRRLGEFNRGKSPTAAEIAAEIAAEHSGGVTAAQLLNWCSNRHKHFPARDDAGDN